MTDIVESIPAYITPVGIFSLGLADKFLDGGHDELGITAQRQIDSIDQLGH